jgi:predicted O-methyltransferase YrrM
MPEFTVNWLNEPNRWQQHLVPPLAGQPIHALEIGSFEGRSACWLLEHVLTHRLAHLDCVDPFQFSGSDSESRREAEAYAASMEATRRRFLANIAPYGKRVQHYQMPSDEFFQKVSLDDPWYSLVVVDGMHSAMPTLRDLVHAWQVLKPGGLLLIDDLFWKGRDGFVSNGPAKALDALLHCLPETDVAVRYRHYIGILEKLQ